MKTILENWLGLPWSWLGLPWSWLYYSKGYGPQRTRLRTLVHLYIHTGVHSYVHTVDGRNSRTLFETLNDRLPLKNSSHSRQTFRKHVSDDSQHLIFRPEKIGQANKNMQKQKCLTLFVRIVRSWKQIDLKIESSIKFCFGCTYAQVCAIEFSTLTESVREFLPSTVGLHGVFLRG